MNTLHFEWCDDFVIDNGEIDDEHKQLLKMANEVFALVTPDAQMGKIVALVKGLYQYMESHFEHEEKLMAEVGFPRAAEHAAKHKAIIAQMNNALRVQRKLGRYAAQLKHLMLDWVVQHIIEDDQQLAPYLAKRASSATNANEQAT